MMISGYYPHIRNIKLIYKGIFYFLENFTDHWKGIMNNKIMMNLHTHPFGI